MSNPLLNACPACGGTLSSGTKVIIESRELRNCINCGHKFSSCTSDEFNIAISTFSEHPGTYPTHDREINKRKKRVTKILTSAAQKSSQVTYLDVGCSNGFSIEVGNQLGYHSSGVETALQPASNAINKGLDVFHGTLEQAQFNDNQFDIISLFEVIEHIPDPLPLLLEIRRILKHDGTIIISTGNTRSISAAILKEKWDYYKMSNHGGHISFFNPSSINTLASRSGLAVNKIRTRRVSLTATPSDHKALKYISEIISFPASTAGFGHDMIIELTKAPLTLAP